ncbi:epoxide hydrolase family protein [Aquipuribacter hungaricus]|uniref:Epoxide hydrolase family protein n=1 Tax=Aquipuribacter hungaricus TaxID=545624 RepID=A0ABV7WI25_9MICO
MTTTARTDPATDDLTQPPADPAGHEQVRPFAPDVPQAALDDLRRRLQQTRWPDPETVDDSSQGPRLSRLQALVEHWRDRYAWRRCEALLAGLGQSVTTIDGLDIHFLHVRSPEPGALPLVLTHGWPGSVLEFRHVIGPLTDPVAHGGRAEDAFHVVVPSLPGFGFSGRPTGTGWGLARTAAAWSTLVQRLGYDRWVAQGGDWGAAVTTVLAHMGPGGLAGIHLNLVAFRPTAEEVAAATPHEQRMLDDAARYGRELSAYMPLQATRPQTIGYSLADSPVGQAAWIYAMFQDVSDSGGDAESVFTLDEMLDDITLYWLTNTAASSARLYWEAMGPGAAGPPPSGPVTLPTGISMFPAEQVRLSRRWAESRFSSLVHFDELEAGGHFAALEQPALFVDQLRTTFRGLR